MKNNKFKNNKTNFLYILGRHTWYLQPLDFKINMLFKEALKMKYINEITFLLDNKNKVILNYKYQKENIIKIVN